MTGSKASIAAKVASATSWQTSSLGTLCMAVSQADLASAIAKIPDDNFDPKLGGKSAAIILDDVNLDDALLNELLMSGLMNNGQVCGAQSRILVPRSRYDEIVGKIGEEEFAGGKMENADVEIGGSDFIPGFAEQLAGAKAGEERTITVTFPADYRATELAGKEATIVSEFAGKKIVREPVPIAKEEPLKLELAHFIESVRVRRAPRVTGAQAKVALEVAFEIVRQIQAGR